MRDLGTLPGGQHSSTVDINDQGQVVGTSNMPRAGVIGGVEHAVRWDSTAVIRDLGTLGGRGSSAVAINEAGQVVGSSDVPRARRSRGRAGMSTHGAPFTTSWELLYDPDGLRPKTASDQVTFTPVPGEDSWWFACCAD